MSGEERVVNFLTALVAARWLGHGRRMEFFLVFAAGLGAVVLFSDPMASEHIRSLSGLFWLGYGRYLFWPYFAVFLISGYGLLANKFVWPLSRVARFTGALIGFFFWFTYSVQLWQLNLVATPGFILALPAALIGELGVMFTSAANLPRPGAPGNLGI